MWGGGRGGVDSRQTRVRASPGHSAASASRRQTGRRRRPAAGDLPCHRRRRCSRRGGWWSAWQRQGSRHPHRRLAASLETGRQTGWIQTDGQTGWVQTCRQTGWAQTGRQTGWVQTGRRALIIRTHVWQHRWRDRRTDGMGTGQHTHNVNNNGDKSCFSMYTTQLLSLFTFVWVFRQLCS